MSEKTENTISAYLGPEFQLRLMWQLLVEPEFAEKIIPDLSVDYFDDPNLKRLFIIILEYFNDYEKVPNLQNQSIHHAINKYKTPNNPIEEETLFSVIKKIELWNQRVLNKELFYDGDVVQKEIFAFIKQQEYRKLGETILDKTRTGEIKQKYFIGFIEDKITKISQIGAEEDEGTEITEGISKALRKEFRQTIPTGVNVLDNVTGGGLGKGEIGVILSPSGVGKTTLLTKIANTAYEHEFNVLQIIFEDTEDQVKRKHYSIWSGFALSEMDTNNDEAEARVNKKIEEDNNKGRLVIRRFSQEDTTMTTIKSYIEKYQKKHGFKFDIIILDYLDCLEPNRKVRDQNEAELAIIKSFEAMAGDYDIPCWTAIQSNRSGFGAEFVEAYQTGGSIKRLQKAHFFMSIAKTQEQQEGGLANIRILKARFAKDGQAFNDCIFDNDQMRIVIKDKRYNQEFKGRKKYEDEDIEKLGEKVRNTKTTTGDIWGKVGEKYDDNNLLPIDEDIKLPSTKDILNDIHKDDAVSDAVNDGENDAVTDERLMKDTEINEETTEKLNDIENDGFTWTGETMTVNEGDEPEVKITENNDGTTTVTGKLLEFDDEPNENGRVYNKDTEVNFSGATGTFEHPEENRIETKMTTEKFEEVTNRFTDEEELSEEKKRVADILMNMSGKQGVIKKE